MPMSFAFQKVAVALDPSCSFIYSFIRLSHLVNEN